MSKAKQIAFETPKIILKWYAILGITFLIGIVIYGIILYIKMPKIPPIS